MGESVVPASAIADAAELLTQNADVLLERLADKVMAAPAAGSPAWYALRSAAGAPPALTVKARLLVRIAIAHQAHFDLVEDIERARAAGAQWPEIGEATGLSAARAKRRWDRAPIPARPHESSGQLAIW